MGVSVAPARARLDRRGRGEYLALLRSMLEHALPAEAFCDLFLERCDRDDAAGISLGAVLDFLKQVVEDLPTVVEGSVEEFQLRTEVGEAVAALTSH